MVGNGNSSSVEQRCDPPEIFVADILRRRADRRSGILEIFQVSATAEGAARTGDDERPCALLPGQPGDLAKLVEQFQRQCVHLFGARHGGECNAAFRPFEGDRFASHGRHLGHANAASRPDSRAMRSV